MSAPTMKAQAMPPLPVRHTIACYVDPCEVVYTADQMRAYGRACLEAMARAVIGEHYTDEPGPDDVLQMAWAALGHGDASLAAAEGPGDAPAPALLDAAKEALEAIELHANQYPHMVKGYTVDACRSLRAAIAASAPSVVQAEPVAWADEVEQRLLTWRQRLMNRSGDHLALDDFMDKESLEDLIDCVCAPLAAAAPPAPADDIQRADIGTTGEGSA